MKFALLLTAFLGWGILGYFADRVGFGSGFIIGMAVGAGAMLMEKK